MDVNDDFYLIKPLVMHYYENDTCFVDAPNGSVFITWTKPSKSEEKTFSFEGMIAGERMHRRGLKSLKEAAELVEDLYSEIARKFLVKDTAT